MDEAVSFKSWCASSKPPGPLRHSDTPGQAALSPDLPQRAVGWRASGVSLACGRSPSRSSSSPQSAATLRPDTVNAPPLPSSKPDPDLLATQDGHAPRVTSGYDGRDSATMRLSACRRLRLDTPLGFSSGHPRTAAILRASVLGPDPLVCHGLILDASVSGMRPAPTRRHMRAPARP